MATNPASCGLIVASGCLAAKCAPMSYEGISSAQSLVLAARGAGLDQPSRRSNDDTSCSPLWPYYGTINGTKL